MHDACGGISRDVPVHTQVSPHGRQELQYLKLRVVDLCGHSDTHGFFAIYFANPCIGVLLGRSRAGSWPIPPCRVYNLIWSGGEAEDDPF